MDTVLNLFRDCLPSALARSRPTLKSMVDALGSVRDVDIRLEAVAKFRNGLPEGDRPALDPLLRHLESERNGARAAMLRALDAKPTREWLDSLPDQLARAASAAVSASSRNAAALKAVPELIRKRYRKLRQCARRLTRESSLEQFHKVRVRTKKLRYAVEVVAPTYGRPAEKMLAALYKLQSRLGTQHDADVVARYLTHLAIDPPQTFTAATIFMMGRMAEGHATEAVRMGPKVERPWRKVRGRRWKAVRARMRALRKDAREKEKSVTREHHHPAAHGRLASSGAHARLNGNGRLSGAVGKWMSAHMRTH